MNELNKNQKIYFIGEKIPYVVKAISERYVIVSRKLNRREDADLLHHMVKMSAYSSFTSAYDHLKESPVYSILDFQKNLKAPHNLIFGPFDYFKDEDCEEAIKWLEKGEMELSHRNRAELHIDWDKTNKIKK